LYSGQQFLDVGRQNQDRLQKDRIGLMQDTFASILFSTNFSGEVIQKEIVRIAEANPDITDFKVIELSGRQMVPIAALDAELIGVPEEYAELYRNAAVRLDESLIFEVFTTEGRVWLTYRAMQSDEGIFYFIYTQVSLQAIDNSFKSGERDALYSLIFVYVFILALAYWHIRLTDYRYLYIKVRKANEMKDLFTNMIAHELRAPLTAIRGYSSMLIEAAPESDVQQIKNATRVKDSSERLLAIVNDLLDVARIQSGKLSVEVESFDASEIVIAVTDELHVSAVENKVKLKHSGAIETHIVVGDRKRLHQAITNLVSNAIKYTKDGVIELVLEEKYNTVEIRVKDTGMGISSEDQKQLFAPFFRVQNDDVSQITGTGLGMWITKQLVELMGAKIGVESIKGVGTHVVVKLPKEVKDHGTWKNKA
jgi:signal transduction histidine kinase